MSFTYTPTVPAANDYPGDDQPLMLTNTQSIANLIAVDHVSFNLSDGGTHEQVTYSSKNIPSAPTEPVSIAFTASASNLPGSTVTNSASSKAQQFFRNQYAIFPMSAVRAFANFTNSGSPVINNAFNVVSITRSGGIGSRIFTITLVNNATRSNTPIVLMNSDDGTVLGYSFASDVLTITTSGTTLTLCNFVVLEI